MGSAIGGENGRQTVGEEGRSPSPGGCFTCHGRPGRGDGPGDRRVEGARVERYGNPGGLLYGDAFTNHTEGLILKKNSPGDRAAAPHCRAMRNSSPILSFIGHKMEFCDT